MTQVANDAEAPLEPARCSECDRMVTHYNTFITPHDEQRVVCWSCRERDEKGFFAKRGFQRDARRGTVVR